MSTAPAMIPPAGEKPFSVAPPRHWWQRGLLLAVLAALIAGAAIAAARFYPDGAPPRGSELEAKIAGVFGVPADSIDGRVVGDLLIERFYAIDADTGNRYVGDFLKGRIQSVQTTNDNGLLKHTLVLSLQNLTRDRAIFSTFIEEVARPRERSLGEYLGVRVPQGTTDAFSLNYSGLLPEQRTAFSSSENESLQEFLASRRFAEVTASPELIGVDGYNYLLSNTEVFPYFSSIFGIRRAIFVSELLIVDATAQEQQRTYYKLTEKFPRTLR